MQTKCSNYKMIIWRKDLGWYQFIQTDVNGVHSDGAYAALFIHGNDIMIDLGVLGQKVYKKCAGNPNRMKSVMNIFIASKHKIFAYHNVKHHNLQ